MKLFRGLYFLGIALILLGGYFISQHLFYGAWIFSAGVGLYSFVQIRLLFVRPARVWGVFEFLKLGVNILFILSVVLLLGWKLPLWYLPFILGLLLDFISNIIAKIRKR